MILPAALNNSLIIGEITINDVWTFSEKNNMLLLVQELHKLQGLDSSNPVTITPILRSVDDINIEIGGNGTSLATLTRV
jgi:hypothetical protein